MQASILLLLAFATPSALALSTCPSAHLEPTLNYGRGFGNPEKITIHFDTGSRSSDEDLAFQYFEFQSSDPGYARVYAVHVLQNEDTKKGRVFLARIKDGIPVTAEMPLSEKTVDLVIAIATPVVLATRFKNPPCTVLYTDGYVIQVGVEPKVGSRGFIGGEANIPIPGTPVHQLQLLGRALRAVALGELPESKLEGTLKEQGVIKP